MSRLERRYPNLLPMFISENTVGGVHMRCCTQCKRDFPMTKEYFFKNIKSPVGFDTKCKECRGSPFGLKKNFVNNGIVREGYKICPSCEQEKPITLEHFHGDKTKKHGLSTTCKDCSKVKWTADYKTHYAIHKERIAVANKKWRDNNKDKATVLRRSFELKNKTSLAIKAHNRRAKRRGLIHTLTVSQWEQCKMSFNHHCAYCGKQPQRLEQDHFYPLNKGGEYTVNNIVPSCKSCNSSKVDSDFEQWFRKQSFFNEERRKKILEYLQYKNGIQQVALF